MDCENKKLNLELLLEACEFKTITDLGVDRVKGTICGTIVLDGNIVELVSILGNEVNKINQENIKTLEDSLSCWLEE